MPRHRRGSGFVPDDVDVDLTPPAFTVQGGVSVANEGTVFATDLVGSDGGVTDFEVRRESGTDEDYAASITGTLDEADSTVDVLVRGVSPWPGHPFLVLPATVQFSGA